MNMPNANNSSIQKISTKNINTNSVFVALLTLVSRLLGFVRIAIISAFFGASGSADVLNLVLSIPNNLRKLFAEGALFNAYMPSFANTVSLSNRATPESNKFFSELSFWVALVSLVFVVLMSYFSSYLTSFLFDLSDPTQISLADNLFSYAIYFLWFVILAALCSGILQTHKRFIIPALSPIIMSIFTVASILLLHASYQTLAVVYGYLLGAAVQVLLLLVATIVIGYRIFSKEILYNFLKFLRPSAEFILTLKRIPPIALAVILPIIGQQITFYFASTLRTGSSSAFAYAIVYWQFPVGVIINSIINVNYAFLLTLMQHKSYSDIKTCIVNALEKICLFVIPISIMFIFFAHAGVAVTLQRGNMQSNAILLTAKILQAFAYGLLPMGFYLFFQKILYSLQKNTLVFVYSFLFTVVDVILSFLLIQTRLQVVGLAFAYTFSLILIVPIMYFHIKRYIKFTFPFRQLGKILIGVLPLIAISWFLSVLTERYWFEGSHAKNILRFSILSLIILTILIIGLRMIGINMLKSLKTLRSNN